jgi:hypothetical protein
LLRLEGFSEVEYIKVVEAIPATHPNHRPTWP